MNKSILLLAVLFGLAYSQDFTRCLKRLGEDGVDQCHSDFAGFLDCIDQKVRLEVGEILDEVDEDGAIQCFGSSPGCPRADSDLFTEQKALDVLMPCRDPKDIMCRWREIVEILLDVLNSVNTNIANCLVSYFKDLATKRINRCAHEKGMSNFYMPKIPGFDIKDGDIEKFKGLVLYRLMVRTHLTKCNCGDEDLVECLTENIDSNLFDSCGVSDDCTAERVSGSCVNRQRNVHSKLCSCAEESIELAKSAFQSAANGNGGISAFTSLKKQEPEFWDAITRDGIKCAMEQCFIADGPVSQALWEGDGSRRDGNAIKNKIGSLKGKFISAFVKSKNAWKNSGIPAEIQTTLDVLKSLIEDVVNKYGGLFCGDCSNNIDDKSNAQNRFRSILPAEVCPA